MWFHATSLDSLLKTNLTGKFSLNITAQVLELFIQWEVALATVPMLSGDKLNDLYHSMSFQIVLLEAIAR